MPAEVLAEFDLVEAEFYQRAEFADAARKFAAIDAALSGARSNPEVYLGFSPLTGRDAIEMAERAAVADLGVRMQLSENTVRAYGHSSALTRPRQRM